MLQLLHKSIRSQISTTVYSHFFNVISLQATKKLFLFENVLFIRYVYQQVAERYVNKCVVYKVSISTSSRTLC